MRALISVGVVALALTQPSARSAEVSAMQTSDKHAHVIYIDGDLDPATMFDLQANMANISPQKKRQLARRKAYLNSKGGDLDVGLKLGRFFRRYRFRTYVKGGDKCISACALAFLGGTNEGTKNPIAFRTKHRTGVIGFHALKPDIDGTLNKRQAEQLVYSAQDRLLKLINFFLDVDGDPRILKRMLLSKEVFYISNDEALDYCIHVNSHDDDTQPAINPYEFRYALGTPTDQTTWSRSYCKYKK